MMKYLWTALLFFCLAPNLAADNFGYCSDGSSWQTVEGQRWANRSTPTSSGPLDSMGVYLQVTTDAHNVHCAVYKMSDSSLVDSTEIINVGVGTAWIYFDFIGNDSLFADTEYALVVQAEPASGVCNVGYTTGGGASIYDILAQYGAWQVKWTTIFGTGSDRFSLCCYYTGPAPEGVGIMIIIQQ